MDDTLTVLREMRSELASELEKRVKDRDIWREGTPNYNRYSSLASEAEERVDALDQAIAIVEEVTRLREQNTRLKEALEPFTFPMMTLDESLWSVEQVLVQHIEIRRARVALEEGEKRG